MAKVNKSKILAPTKAKTKSNNTPFNPLNGEVHKIRVNDKKVKLPKRFLTNSFESRDLPNLPKRLSPKTRLCFVKLKRTHIISNEQSRKNTLQAQCNLNENVAIEDTNKEHNKSPQIRDNKSVDITVGTAKNRNGSNQISAEATGDRNYLMNKKETNSNKISVSSVKTKNRLKNEKVRLPVVEATGDNRNYLMNKKETNSNKISVSSVKPKNGHKNEKVRLPKETTGTKPNENSPTTSTNNKIIKRRCVVNIKRTVQKSPTKTNDEACINVLCTTPNTNKTITRQMIKSCVTSTNNKIIKRRCVDNIKHTAQKSPTDTNDEARINELCTTPNTNKKTRQCVAKLKHTPLLTTKTIKDQKSKMPSKSSSTRKCLVRLQKTPVKKKSTGKGENLKTTEELIDLSANESPTIVPALDEVKRKNFRKLSLNQSPITKLNKQNKDANKKANKIVKFLNDNKSKEMTSNFVVEMKDKNSKHTNGKETNSSESKSIRNNTENEETTDTNLAHLNQVTTLKRVPKLSLKKPCNKTKSTTNVEITQLEAQQNSIICFQPVRNSTLVEFGCINGKNRDYQIEENKNKEQQIEDNNNDQEKDDTSSSSKNKSSSQNYANKSQEIENLLNSLEDDNDNNEDKHIEENNNNRDKEKENIFCAKNQFSSQNISKSQENENILNYLVDEYENDKAVENQTKTLPLSKKPNKFFHRHEKNSPENTLKEVEVVTVENKSPLKSNCQEKNVQQNISKKVKNKSTGARKKRNSLLKKRSSITKRDNVYDFLSQSQTSDSDSNKHLDPAADIIKRLIDEGRVRVATNYKGKGRPIIKRKATNTHKTKRIKQNTVTRKAKTKHLNADAQKLNNNENQDLDNDDHFMDNFDHNEPLLEVENDIQQPQGVKALTNQNHHTSDQEGTFSRLARSVLIKQAGHSGMQRQKAKRLLEMAKKFVSTPKNKKTSLPHDVLYSDLSPIAMPPPRPAGIASPWRVDEDAHLPRIFNFNTSSGNLPSFSSDFIPSTPRKENPKNKTIPQQESTTNQQLKSPLPAIDMQTHSRPVLAPLSPLPQGIVTTTNDPSVISSFSSNDSNAENMPPVRTVQENNNENNNIFDLKQFPNPRRTLNYRSPLKAINILEVVHLPPYKPNANKTPQSNDVDKDNANLFNANKTPQSNDIIDKDNANLFGFEENLTNDSIIAESDNAIITPQKTLAKNTKKLPSQEENLFGFEDFLTQTDFSSQECCDDDIETIENKNKTIHNKLQDLRKLKPEENALQLSLLKEKSRAPQKTLALFDNGDDPGVVDADGLRQRGIKEMLCSTMIDEPKPSTSKSALAQLKKRNLKDLQRPNFGEGSNLSELFKDPEPETTLNENDAHRTYIRPYKRKRRLRQNNFVMFLDSDESDEHDSAEHQKHHHSHETDTSAENAPKKKRQRKEQKEKPELTEFIHDFNEMCKDVESYNLIIERSH